MKHNKLNAFTLAELLVLLLTLSILMAAFAPVFTKRYNNVTSDEVWSFIMGDDQKNAYYDSINKTFTSQAFIGLTPVDEQDVAKMVEDEVNKPVYSKLVIAASKKLNATGRPQHQMLFRHGDDAGVGKVTAGIFAGNGNMLIGNAAKGIEDDAKTNTSFGSMALNGLTKGDNNTAVGYNSLGGLTAGSGNTAIGVDTGQQLRKANGNTIIGNRAGSKLVDGTSQDTEYSTVIGVDSIYGTSGSYNTIIGYKAGNATKDANTAVGAYSLGGRISDPSKGDLMGNTAVGYKALSNLKNGYYNTAIGASACSLFDSNAASINGKFISKVTCVGANSVSDREGNETDTNYSAAGLISHSKGNEGDVPDRVFLGSFPQSNKLAGGSGEALQPFAVVEVHNSVEGIVTNGESAADKIKTLSPNPGGRESVIINGNLIVRGQSYFEVPIMRNKNVVIKNDEKNERDRNAKPIYIPKGLVLFKLAKHRETGAYVFSGYDGTDRDASPLGRSKASCHGCKNRGFDVVRPNCICTAVGPTPESNQSYVHGYYSTKLGRNTTYRHSGDIMKLASTSYDWFTETNNTNCIDACDCSDKASSYTDKSENVDVGLSYYPHGIKNEVIGADNGWESYEVDGPLAHLKDKSPCCPNLTSDRRLKDVGEKFTAGLEEIKKLNVYHFTYKNDKNQLPHVGVIAQDLKRVFPTAVNEDKNGYYQIRWDEMLYAAVNAVKTLNSKIVNLADKVAKTQVRIANLKKDNAELYAQLDTLASELTALESKRK